MALSKRQQYLNSKKRNNRFMDEVQREEKFLKNIGKLGRGVKSHQYLRTKQGCNVLVGTERAGIYKKKTKGVVSLDRPEIGYRY